MINMMDENYVKGFESKEVALYLAYLDILDDAIIGITNNLKISYWSKGAERKLGYTSEEAINKSLEIIIPKDRIDEYKTLMKDIRNGVMIKNFETAKIHKNGDIIDVSISIAPILDKDGNCIGALGIYKDIEQGLEDKVMKLEQMKQQAEDANRAKSQFLANITHGIRTPLNAIHLATQILELSSDESEQRKYINILKESTLSLKGIINDILDFAKIESGKLELNNTAFDLRKTIYDIYNDLIIQGNSKGLEIGFYLDPTLTPQVIGDELKLKQILTNLIHNAIKFTDEGYISFKVNVISSDEDVEEIEFLVKDSGIGIREEIRHQIFQHFIQGTTANNNGTGLGLAISRQLATLMGGEIQFESIVGQGSTFYFRCKFKKVTPLNNREENNYSGVKEIKDYISSYSEKKILCVEDDIINQQVLGGIIKRKGYKSIPAYNGKDALEILETEEVDLIIMDIQMLELNGFDTTKIIRSKENLKDIPIIAITAYAFYEDREKCLQAGMNDYISKPIDIEKFYNMLDYYLGAQD